VSTPREVVQRALALNAAAVIVAHNHPSGEAEPNRSDARPTATLCRDLTLDEVRVLDHLIVAGSAMVPFAERGLLWPDRVGMSGGPLSNGRACSRPASRLAAQSQKRLQCAALR
jgi:hypothetical protein